MLFLVLFAVLALGFYAATAMSMQLSANERSAHSSQIAAESGMQFIRYQLDALDIPADRPPPKVFEEIYLELSGRLDGTPNLGGGCVGYDGRTISIPEGTDNFVRMEQGGPGFRVVMTDISGERIRVRAIGSSGDTRSSLGRAVEMEYDLVNRKTTAFDYGVASRGTVQFKPSPTTRLVGTPDSAAGVLSTSPASTSITTGSGPIEGDLSVAFAKSQVTLGGGAVGGANASSTIIADHVHVVAAPEFPYVHTTVFAPFATNAYVAGVARQKNIRIAANTNPTFGAGQIVDGILYIESPNVVTFTGTATINGVIVFENRNTVAQNVLDFKGSVLSSAMPPDSEFDALRQRARGLAIAAPTAAVTLTGNVGGRLEGTVIAGKLSLTGSADLTIDRGSLISLGTDPTLVQGKTVEFMGSASDNPPYAGVRLRANFRPNPATYREVNPDAP